MDDTIAENEKNEPDEVKLRRGEILTCFDDDIAPDVDDVCDGVPVNEGLKDLVCATDKNGIADTEG